MARYLIPLIVSAGLALAKTDHEGCTSFTSTVTVRTEIGYGNTYETIIWYVPDTLEICQGVDCGGGRAPPRNVPGCPIYSGTETVTPKFLPTDPAAVPASTVVTVTPTRTSTVETVTRTTTASVLQSSSAGTKDGDSTTGTVQSQSVRVFTGLPTLTLSTSTTILIGSASEAASGSASGSVSASASGPAAARTDIPAGAGPTARAGLAAALGVAAAVALV
ncbi:uncharacterized protein CTRU02_211654 [Colletotrichum truncatum]|uniref:Uncharacterized protein n=1 Tax=Colletotrichum truncatum TaxID=5467 RepID=A0ACC3YLU6_COLTU|nr:uncharacterized protein CTRU02_14641 [Colletotrichum truncatum]KAF6781960.1 hypothetical protein CTRU02_14641 [Colletotrichum truncatum]